MKILFTVLVLVALLLPGVIGFAYSGPYDVAASSEHGRISGWLLSTTSHASIARRAVDIEVPDLDDVTLIQAGVSDFDAMCSGCYGAPGKPPEAVGQGLNPPAPDDEAVWPVVAFMHILPDLRGDQYQALLASAEGAGHHAPEEAHVHDSGGGDPPLEDMPESVPEVDDHSTHEHEH